MQLTHFEIIALILLGLAAGALGGMLGIGGSIIMIPVLTLLLHRSYHLSQAVAMIVNVFVALPALLPHHRAKAIRWDVMAKMLPFGVAFILVGVESSNGVDATMLQRAFGAFLLYVIATNVVQLVSRRPEPQLDRQRTGWWRAGVVGTATGFIAGLLGVGGGIIAVPMLQRVCNLPLRQCIATTAAFMCVTATFGALRKNFALDELGLSVRESLVIASCLAPTAVLGSLAGGRLAHALPLSYVRVAFILLMAWAAADMLDLI